MNSKLEAHRNNVWRENWQESQSGGRLPKAKRCLVFRAVVQRRRAAPSSRSSGPAEKLQSHAAFVYLAGDARETADPQVRCKRCCLSRAQRNTTQRNTTHGYHIFSPLYPRRKSRARSQELTACGWQFNTNPAVEKNTPRVS